MVDAYAIGAEIKARIDECRRIAAETGSPQGDDRIVALQIEIAQKLGITPEEFAKLVEISTETAEEIYRTKTNITPGIIRENRFIELNLVLDKIARPYVFGT